MSAIDKIGETTLEHVVGTYVTLSNAPMDGVMNSQMQDAFARRAAELAGFDINAFTSWTVQRFTLDSTANVYFYKN